MAWHVCYQLQVARYQWALLTSRSKTLRVPHAANELCELRRKLGSLNPTARHTWKAHETPYDCMYLLGFGGLWCSSWPRGLEHAHHARCPSQQTARPSSRWPLFETAALQHESGTSSVQA
jgi:hypothetical protein